MNAEKWKQTVMLVCFSVLVIVMGMVIIRLGTAKVLIKHFHQNNIVTRLIFQDDPNIFLRDKDRKPEEKIDWSKHYPFTNVRIEHASIISRAFKKFNTVKSPLVKHPNSISKYIWPYWILVESGRRYEESIGWTIINPSQRVMKLSDGSLVYTNPKQSQQERIESMNKLNDFVTGQGAKLLFVQAPYKVDEFNDTEVTGKLDFSNQNADELLDGLMQHGIKVFDLREMLHRVAPTAEAYHSLFYRTDHHWHPQTALLAANLLTQQLQSDGIPIDQANYVLTKYNVETKPKFFLGSQGKKVTLAKTVPDDFDVVTPDFPIKLHVEIPSCRIDEVGGFNLLLEPRQIEHVDYYNLNPYAFYGHGDVPLMRIENLNQPTTKKKIMIIHDSFGDTFIPYLSLGCRQVVALDVRHFTGSVEAFIRKEKPDLVMVMYTAGDYDKKIDWSNHTDEFDFR